MQIEFVLLWKKTTELWQLKNNVIRFFIVGHSHIAEDMLITTNCGDVILSVPVSQILRHPSCSVVIDTDT